MIQTSLFEESTTPTPARRPRARSARENTSPFLIDIFSSTEPLRRALYKVDGRDLSVTVDDNTITLDLAGRNGGKGQQIVLPVEILDQITALINTPFEERFLL